MSAASFVPEVSTLKDVYPNSAHEAQKPRWEHLLSRFKETYGAPASFISRSPGRVNIIGEHIDYSLFSVLPMAIEADLLLAVRVLSPSEGESIITLTNVLSKYPQRSFTVPPTGSGSLEIDSTRLEWSNYFKAGYRGALEFLRRNGVAGADRPPGMQILVDGNVPSGGGLSSSAAFVCASALAGMVSMDVQTVDKKELVELAIVSERYVGVNSGGMDQSASVFGEEGKALFISFSPQLTADAVAFPKDPEPVFLIANTYKTVEKHVMAPEQYNLRVVECTIAAEVLAKACGVALPADAGPLGSTLKGFMDSYYREYGDSEKPLLEKLSGAERLVEEKLHAEGYTRSEMAELLGITVDEMVGRYMTKFPIRGERFALHSRAKHAFSEAARVVKMYSLLKESKQGGEDSGPLQKLGALMDDSQKGCRELYECSSEELDELCELARANGSYGSRLTGAGWGGCSVHLVPRDKVDAIKQAWLKDYYGKRFPDLSGEKLREAIVVTQPGAGSVLFKVPKENELL